MNAFASLKGTQAPAEGTWPLHWASDLQAVVRILQRSEGASEESAELRLQRDLEGVEHVAGEQSENRHHQDRFQLLVVRLGTTVVIARRLLWVILNSQTLAWTVRGNMLYPVMTEFAVIHLPLIAYLIGELDLVVTPESSQVVVEPDPLT
jgi:hypothetical protein